MNYADALRAHRHGKPGLYARFMSKANVSDETGCWIWEGGKSGGNGYGLVYLRGDQPLYAHRVSHRMFNGRIPAGLHVLHTCDCKSCVNPEHLYAGTHADNMRDAVDRGRHVGRKLTASKARAIVARSDAGCTNNDLAVEFGVSVHSIARILRGENWSKATGIAPGTRNNRKAGKGKRQTTLTPMQMMD